MPRLGGIGGGAVGGGGRLVTHDWRGVADGLAGWTNMPAAEAWFFGQDSYRRIADLTGCTEVRLLSNQGLGGAAGAVLKLQYSLDGAAWVDLCSLDAATVAVKEGAWAAIPAEAQASVHLRVVGVGGDGVADPSWRWLASEAR